MNYLIQKLTDEGRFFQDVDGCYYFDLGEGQGALATHNLRAIADELDRLNKENLPSIKKVEYEFQYLDQSGMWKTGSFEQEESRARKHFNMMTRLFPAKKYRLIRRTILEEVILQNTEVCQPDKNSL